MVCQSVPPRAGGRRALRETDALHDKIEFLEQENLDLMLEVKALKASQAALEAERAAHLATATAGALADSEKTAAAQAAEGERAAAQRG